MSVLNAKYRFLFWRPVTAIAGAGQCLPQPSAVTADGFGSVPGFDDGNPANVHGFDAAGAAGNLDAVHHFDTVEQLRTEVIDARLWGGLHYRRSSEVGVHLGRKVAHYGLDHAFKPTR